MNTRGGAINRLFEFLNLYHSSRVEQNSSSSLYLVHHLNMVKGRQH